MAKRRKRKKPLKLKIRPETLHSIVASIFVLLGILIIVSFSGQGELLTKINKFLSLKLGLSMLFLPFVAISAGMVLFRSKWAWSKPNVLLGTLLLMLGTLGFLQTGSVGLETFNNLSRLVTSAGAYAVFGTIFFIGALIITQLSIDELFEHVGKLSSISLPQKKQKEETDIFSHSPADMPKRTMGFKIPKLSFSSHNSNNQPADEGVTAVPEQSTQLNESAGEEPTGEFDDDMLIPNSSQIIWEYPPLSLLSQSEGGQADRGDVKKNAQTIESTLESFGIRAQVVEVNYGPSVTQYALEISRGTKLSKITSLSTDLALALAAPTGQIRIEAPIAGRSLVGVEVPNYSAQYVTLRKMLASPEMKKNHSKLANALGISVSGKPVIMDLAKMPHVLIAGSTGSGKSVAINSLICSMLFRASPAEVKFILVDPKRVELTGYNDIPHLLVPVIVDPKKVISALRWATHEMDNRYKQLAEVGVRNITSYNELAGHAAMPNIVIVVDELADIMLFAPSEVEEAITRIAQMARAVGIHLVLATQRPSVDVITGLIKANIPARVAFNVSSMTDSRVVLDAPGAEKLLGKGDMLYTPPDQAKPSRVQGTYVSDQEIKSLIDFIKSQGQKPEYEEDITSKYKMSAVKGSGVPGAVDDEKDELFDEVAKYVLGAKKGSSSMIQRRFSVGYNRAARILDQLHAAGMVGPAQGSKPREVYESKVMEHFASTSASEN